MRYCHIYISRSILSVIKKPPQQSWIHAASFLGRLLIFIISFFQGASLLIYASHQSISHNTSSFLPQHHCFQSSRHCWSRFGIHATPLAAISFEVDGHCFSVCRLLPKFYHYCSQGKMLFLMLLLILLLHAPPRLLLTRTRFPLCS